MIIALAGLFSCAGEQPKPSVEAQPEEISDEQVKAMYTTMCGICHGHDGKLGAGGSKDLTLSEMNLDERVAIITKGKSTMLPFEGRLTPEEIVAVAKYLDKLKN